MKKESVEKLRDRVHSVIGNNTPLSISSKAPSTSGGSSAVGAVVISVIIFILGFIYVAHDVSSRSYIVPGQGTIGAVGNTFKAAGSALEIIGVVVMLIIVTVVFFATRSDKNSSEIMKKYHEHQNITYGSKILSELTTAEKESLDAVLAPYVSNYCKNLERYIADYQEKGEIDATLFNPLFDDVGRELPKTLDYIAKNT